MIKDITYLCTLFCINFKQFFMRTLTCLSNKFNKKTHKDIQCLNFFEKNNFT